MKKPQLAGPNSSHCAIPLLLSFAAGFVHVCVCVQDRGRQRGRGISHFP